MLEFYLYFLLFANGKYPFGSLIVFLRFAIFEFSYSRSHLCFGSNPTRYFFLKSLTSFLLAEFSFKGDFYALINYFLFKWTRESFSVP